MCLQCFRIQIPAFPWLGGVGIYIDWCILFPFGYHEFLDFFLGFPIFFKNFLTSPLRKFRLKESLPHWISRSINRECLYYMEWPKNACTIFSNKRKIISTDNDIMYWNGLWMGHTPLSRNRFLTSVLPWNFHKFSCNIYTPSHGMSL